MADVMRTNLRFAVALTLLLGTGWFLHAREKKEIVLPHVPLATFPNNVGAWTGTNIPIDSETREVLGPGDFLLRRYEIADADEPSVYLFVAYFPSQRTGDTMHSPRNCLPGAGWEPIHSRTVALRFGNELVTANQYVIAKGLERQLVLYWYESQGAAIASEYRAKIQLVLNAIRTGRSDGALIRISTPYVSGESDEDALRRLTAFGDQAVPLIYADLPR
jgi:EpsI family protein